MQECLDVNYEPPDGWLLPGRFCVDGAGVKIQFGRSPVHA